MKSIHQTLLTPQCHSSTRSPKFGEQAGVDASYNIAKNVIEFEITIPRQRLRPNYGDGFRGAPLNTFRPDPSLSGRNQGECQDGSKTETKTDCPGEAHV